MNINIEFIWQSGLYLLACLVLFVVAKFVFEAVNRKVNVGAELVDRDNTAFYVVYICYYLGILSIIAGVMNSEGAGDFWKELMLTGIYGAIGIVLLNVLIILIDNTVHRQVDLWKETVDGKLSIGILKGGNYISTGIIIAGVMLTEVDKPVQTAVYLAGALVFASLGFMYYNLTTPFSAPKHIYDGNSAVAVSAAGAQIAFAILVYAGFQIEHASWEESLASIGVDVIAGFIILPLVRFVLDKLFLPKHRKLSEELIEQEVPNFGLGLFEAVAYIGGALLFVWCWNL